MKQENKIAVTVLIPVYNAAVFLKQTIDSVLKQTFYDFELLLVDDGSTDNTPDIIASYCDSRIKYICCTHSFTGTLNRGLKMAKGQYIALLDHDDLMVPERLQIQYELMQHNPHIAACGGFMQAFGNYSGKKKAPLSHIEILKEMVWHSPMLNPTGFIRNDILIKNGITYSDGYSFGADFKFWADIIKTGEVVNIPEIITLYRTSPDQASVRYRLPSRRAAVRIQHEIIEYILSLMDKKNELSGIVGYKLLPALNRLANKGFFSEQVYFRFMHELISGLFENGIVNLPFTTGKINGNRLFKHPEHHN